MRKITILKVCLQACSMAVTGASLIAMPMLTNRPPERWTVLLALACFSFGLFWGIGVSHFFPSEPERFPQ
ncbi:MAG: hypothetical protein V4559_01710 [Pseudomonadota bacterium]